MKKMVPFLIAWFLFGGVTLLFTSDSVEAGKPLWDISAKTLKKDETKVKRFISRIERAEEHFSNNKLRSAKIYLRNAENEYDKMSEMTKFLPSVLEYKTRYDNLLEKMNGAQEKKKR